MDWSAHRVVRAAAVCLALATGVSALGCISGVPTCKSSKIDYQLIYYKTRLVKEFTHAPEVRSAPNFAELRNTWKPPRQRSAAIRMPDFCRTESSAQAEGVIKQAGASKLGMACGFYLAELERALSAQQYTVISWNTLLTTETTQHLPTHQAAAQLGADIVFIINDLTPADAPLGESAQWSFTAYESDADGSPGAYVGDVDDDKLKEFIEQRTSGLRKSDAIVGYTQVLNTTAVDTKTGQAFWFYLNQNGVLRDRLALDMYFLIARREDDPGYWWPTFPEGMKKPHHHKHKKGATEYTITPPPVDEEQAARLELTRQLVADFIQRFSLAGG